MAAIEEDGGETGHKVCAGQAHGGRAISGPLTPVTSGLSRSLAGTLHRRSGHVQARIAQIPKLTVRLPLRVILHGSVRAYRQGEQARELKHQPGRVRDPYFTASLEETCNRKTEGPTSAPLMRRNYR
jgi:hypothetical protein